MTVWDDIEEAKLDKEEVEELFEDQKFVKQSSIVDNKQIDKSKEK